MMAGFPACYFCIKAFSETDLTEDLKKPLSFPLWTMACALLLTSVTTSMSTGRTGIARL